MQFADSFSLAFRTVKSNKLRTGITIAIIAFGIMALIGIITAIASMNQSLAENFSTMGANGFALRFRDREVHLGRRNDVKKRNVTSLKQKESNNGKIFTYQEAKLFKER